MFATCLVMGVYDEIYIYIYFVLNKICHFKSPIACHYIYHVFVVHCGIFQGANVPVQ